MCGIFGIFNHLEAANITYLGLQALQHRGQESSGIVSSDGNTLHSEIAMGIVADIFTEEKIKNLAGRIAIGHNRYSTSGISLLKNAQPIVIDYSRGALALSHNGNLINAHLIKDELEAYGSIFRSNVDSEVIAHLISQSRGVKLIHTVMDALKSVRGAYSILFMSERELIAARDPYGFRPLSLGKLKDSYVIASETCSFDLIGADFIRDIEPGEAILINQDGLKSFRLSSKEKLSYCIFEFIYFSRPDSNIFGQQNVYDIRKKLGVQLANESHVDADLIIPVPDSGVPAALGYAEETGIPFEMGLIRSHYVGRTFIEPEQSIRHFGVKLKLNAVKKLINGKKVVIIDDSIIRGTTSRKIVKMIRDCGAKEVHFRVSSPLVTNPCYFGIDTPTRKELIASSYSLKEIKKYLTADSLAYLSIECMLNIFEEQKGNFCIGCFNGNYPMPFSKADSNQLALFDTI